MSVQNLHKKMLADPKIAAYMPRQLAKNKLPDRTYFWNVVATVYPQWTKKAIEHANAQRFKSGESGVKMDEVICTPEIWSMLNELPYLSRK